MYYKAFDHVDHNNTEGQAASFGMYRTYSESESYYLDVGKAFFWSAVLIRQHYGSTGTKFAFARG